jgi:hypothetical protein
METVQFSIPTAEILPPPEPEVFSPDETLSPTTYSPASEPYRSEASSCEQPDPTYESTAEPLGYSSPEQESTPEPLPTSATLSDWEARLKRAIAADVDDSPPTEPASKPSFEFTHLKPPETNPEDAVTYEPQDFSIPDADLVPDSKLQSVASQSDWSAENSYQDEEEPTVKFTADQTVSNVVLADLSQNARKWPDEETSVSIRTNTIPSKNRKRSPLRTLVSASLGVVGIPLGLYALLWLRGPAGDMLHIAQYLPSFMLPAEFSELGASEADEQLVQQSPTDDQSEPEDAIASNDSEAEPTADDEPQMREDTNVAPASAELPTYQGPTFALVDAAEFNDLLTAAQQVAPQLSTGDLKSKESVATKGQAYMALARLADKSSFLIQPGHSAEDTVTAQLARQLLQTTLRNEVVQRDLPQIALRWWQYAERPSPGIVLFGEVKRVQTTDAGAIVFVSLAADTVTPEIPVLVASTDLTEGETIGVAGTIEPNLDQRVPAINASLGPVVIAHYSFSLGDAEERVSEAN